MIPTAHIFEETAANTALRLNARREAVSLLWFVVIAAFGAGAYVLLADAFVRAFPDMAEWAMRSLVAASLVLPLYMAHRRYCFGTGVSEWQALPRYLAVQLCVVFAAVLFSQLAYGVFGLPSATSLLLVFALTAGLNHRVLKVWAFAGA